MDYICDTCDNRQAARNRKFEGWFHRFADDSNYTYKGMKAIIEGITFYAAIVIRNDNPRLKNILKAVEQFEADFSSK